MKWKYNKNAFNKQGVYCIEGKKEENKYECRKRRKQLRSKIKVEIADNVFNMELDMLIVVLIRKKGNILENPEKAGEYGRRIQNAGEYGRRIQNAGEYGRRIQNAEF